MYIVSMPETADHDDIAGLQCDVVLQKLQLAAQG
jgi:hypothetical protein